MFIRAAPCAAPCNLAIDHDGGHAADTVLFRLGRHFGLVHIVDDYLMRGTGYPLDHLDCFLARGATGTEDFDFRH